MGDDPGATTPSAPAEGGPSLMALVERLYPICRSITGNGVRQSLEILEEHIPLHRHEVPTGTQVYDWEIPSEWNIRDAWIRDSAGRSVVEFADHNLHVLNYSEPVHRMVDREELLDHVYTLPDQPHAIPYRTSYYTRKWGFCMRHADRLALADERYEVMIDSTLEPGALTLAECRIPGTSAQEVLLSTHICHPSMCNDNLSGIAVATALCHWLLARDNRYTWRVLFVPGTIGSLTWLWLHRDRLERIRAGLVLCGLGDAGGFTYKRSRADNAEIDRVVCAALRDPAFGGSVRDFTPYGYDERQYGAPGFKLPVGRLSRTPHGEYAEYHTSADDRDFISEERLQGALALCQRIVGDLEANQHWRNLAPHGEPQLGKRGLYGGTGGTAPEPAQLALLWMLSFSDGEHSVLDIAERSGMAVPDLAAAAERLYAAGLLAPTREGAGP